MRSLTVQEYQVKGSSISSKFHFVRERFGTAAEQELRTEFPELDGVLDSLWYPFAQFDALLRAIARKFYGGSLGKLVELGEYSAEQALTTVYSAYGHQQTFERMLERIATLHRRFYNLGEMVVDQLPDGNGCQIGLRGAPQYPEADLQVARGFYLGAARHFGHASATCKMEIGARGASFLLEW